MMTPKKTAFVLLLVFFISVLTVPNIIYGAVGNGAAFHPVGPLSRSEAIQSICSVLEVKLKQGKLPPKIQEKLLMLDTAQLGLLASLAERVSNQQETVGADMAFLMLAALLVLS